MSNPLDTKVISKLAEILDKSNLTELEYEGCRICLTRELPHPAPLPPVHPAPVPPAFAPAPVMPQPAAPAAPAPAAPVSEEDYAKLPGAVKSPMVGVVYLSSDPNSPDYVEAMKTFNPVKAHMAGKVTKILVSGGDPVEYGEPLIIIE